MNISPTDLKGCDMTNTDIDLRAEIARVQAELTFFRKECLPPILGGPVPRDFVDFVAYWYERNKVSDELTDWQNAAPA